MSGSNDRRKAMLWGAFVADAAALGWHWMYHQPRIKEVSPDYPEFVEPDAKNFEDARGFFAHPTRKAGDLSHYGHGLLVMLRSISQSGQYDRPGYEAAFKAHFGYGGEFVGYIDHATRGTLDNMTALDKEATAKAQAVDPSMDESVVRATRGVIKGLLPRFSGEVLLQEVETAIRQAKDDDGVVNFAKKVAEMMAEAQASYPGADDNQTPTLAKLPGVIARHLGTAKLPSLIESAVRVTNNRDESVAYAQACATLLGQVLTTGALPDLSTFAAEQPEVKAVVSPVLGRLSEDNVAVTAEVGAACQLKMAVPSVVHNIATAHSFEAATRNNIYAGGDNCGRAILLGAIMGALHGIGGDRGIPEAWIDRLSNKEEIAKLIDAVVV